MLVLAILAATSGIGLAAVPATRLLVIAVLDVAVAAVAIVAMRAWARRFGPVERPDGDRVRRVSGPTTRRATASGRGSSSSAYRRVGRDRARGAALLDPGRGQDTYAEPRSSSTGWLWQPVRSTRGLIYDRKGRRWSRTCPTFAVTVRPGDLPFDQRTGRRPPVRAGRRAAATSSRARRAAGSRFDRIRSRPTSRPRSPASSRRSTSCCRASRSISRRVASTSTDRSCPTSSGGPARSRPRTTAARDGDGYLIDDIIGKAGVEVDLRAELRGQYGVQEVERDAQGRMLRVLRTLEERRPGDSLELTIDLDIQREAEKALRWGMNVVGLTRGVFIVMNPQTGEILAMVSLPAYDNNALRPGHLRRGVPAACSATRDPLLNLAISEQFPPGSTYKLVTGVGALRTARSRPDRRSDPGLHQHRPHAGTTTGTRAGFGPLNIYGGFAHSSDTFFYQLSRDARHRPARLLGTPVRLRCPDGHRPARRGHGHRSRPTTGSSSVFNQTIYPGEIYQAGIGQGYDMVTPLQLINAYAALANGGTLYRPQLVRRVLVAGRGRSCRTSSPRSSASCPSTPSCCGRCGSPPARS